MHKDQKRLQGVFVPQLMDRLMDETPEAERDCTVLNRLLIQGPDPLYLMETCPVQFARLCSYLGLSVEDGRDAIESAHWMGPGCLLEGTGLDAHFTMTKDTPEPPLMWRKEALWLILADMSDCAEEGYSGDITMLARIQKGTTAAIQLAELIKDRDGHGSEVWCDATLSLEKFWDSTEFTTDPRFGVPLTDEDHGFYIGYKQGHSCIAVQTSGPVFYGTTPDTTLAEQGITVDKNVSESYGFVRQDTPMPK